MKCRPDQNRAEDFPKTGSVARQVGYRTGEARFEDDRAERSVCRDGMNGGEFADFIGGGVG